MRELLLLLLLTFFAASHVRAQGPNAAQSAAQSHSQIFSGYVSAMNGGVVTVTRKGSGGKEAVSKVFQMDSQTKVEGRLRVNARVTVRFDANADANRAIRIIVRG